MKRFVLIVMASALLVSGAAAGKKSSISEEIEILKKTGLAFSFVAKKAMPAVVFIQVEKTTNIPGHEGLRYNDPYGQFGDELRDRYFGRGRYHQPPLSHVQKGQGSGFIITKDGYILSNNHVVGDADKITVKLHDGREMEAKMIGADPKSEVALIKIDAKDLAYVELGDSDKLDIGEWVIAVGNPFGLTETLTVGVVSAKGRSNVGIAEYEDFIQTDAAINPGNSGGPLLDIEGKVVGINTAIFSQSGGYMGIGFAVPVNMAKSIKDQLMKNGKVMRGFIGIGIVNVDEKIAKEYELKKVEGILIEKVMEDSAGEKAGLKDRDVILKLNGEKVESTATFRNTIASHPPETKFSLTVLRDGKTQKIKVVTGLLPGEKEAVEGADELFKKLGMTLENLTSDLASRFGYKEGEGVIVTRVEPDGQAENKRIRPANLITRVGERDISSVKDLVSAVKESKKDGKVLLRIKTERSSSYDDELMNVE